MGISREIGINTPLHWFVILERLKHSSTVNLILMSDDETGTQRKQSEKESRKGFVNMRKYSTNSNSMMSFEISSSELMREKSKKSFKKMTKTYNFLYNLQKYVIFLINFLKFKKRETKSEMILNQCTRLNNWDHSFSLLWIFWKKSIYCRCHW